MTFALQRRYILHNKTIAATHIFSRSLTTYTDHYPHHFISYTNQSPLFPYILSHFQQQHGWSMPLLHTPYILNKIISLSAKSNSLETGIQLHTQIIKLGFHSNVYINTALVDMYAKCGVISFAHKLFDEIPERNSVTWNSLISGYSHGQYPEISIEFFIEMVAIGITPTPFSVSAVLVGCARLEDGEVGAQVHCLSLKAGFGLNVVVGTGLIDMYSKCCNLEDSRSLFDQMGDKNVITWTSMVTGYAQNQRPDEAMHLVRQMLRLGCKANYVTYNNLMSSFCNPDDLDHCKQLHCRIIREGLESNDFLVVTLVTVYSQCSCSLDEFYKLCSHIIVWDQISWNAVISGFSNLENGEEALIYFSRMRQAGVDVDFFTFSSVLKACGIISGLEEGKITHALAFRTGYASNVCVQNGHLSMYARCGKIDYMKKVFLSMDEHDLISWNSLLTGYARHGHGGEVVEMFEHMRRSRVKPNSTTFLVVLSALSHVGLLNQGLEYFNLMINDDSLEPPKVEHCACIVDLYGRAGYLCEAEAFIESMPVEPGPSVFKALLSACQVHGNKEIAGRAARKLVELSPNDPATYVTISNVLATGGHWDDAAGVRKLMCDRGVRKEPAYSWI